MFKKLKGTTRLHLLSYTLIAVFLAGVAWAGQTDLDMLVLEPTIDDSYSLKLKNRDGTDKFTVDHAGNVTIVGDLAISGGYVYVSGTTIIDSSGTSIQLTTDYHTYWVNTTLAGTELGCYSGVTLPDITAAMDGWKITFINLTGDTTFNIAPYHTAGITGVTDSIEQTKGTFTAIIVDALVDEAGQSMTWMAHYIASSATGYWIMVSGSTPFI